MKIEDYVRALNDRLKTLSDRVGASHGKSSTTVAEVRAAAEKLWTNSVAGVNHVWESRAQAHQFGKGLVRGGTDGVSALLGHLFARKSELEVRQNLLRRQAQIYGDRMSVIQRSDSSASQSKEFLLETTFLSGDSLVSHINSGQIPEDIRIAYELQYPHLAASHSLVEEVMRLDSHDIVASFPP